jgi:probable phosphoglycerate mutase
MKILFVRHGETDWNVLNKLQGQTDNPLNETGIRQAYALQEKIVDYNIDVIISSPLKRALKTAEIINEKLNVPLIIRKELIERGLGIYESKTREERDVLGVDLRLATNAKIPTVESADEISERVFGLLDDIKKEYKDKTVLLVSHRGVGRVIEWYFDGYLPSNDSKRTLANAEIVEYEC